VAPIRRAASGLRVEILAPAAVIFFEAQSKIAIGDFEFLA